MNLRPNGDEGFLFYSPLLVGEGLGVRLLKFIQTSRGKIHAVVGGEGDPLILVHGLGDVNTWQTWAKNLDALAMVARVYALELLGYGESEEPQETLDAAGHAEVIRELMEREEIQRASFAGLSWGGLVVQDLATKYPEHVDKLILVDSLFDSSEEGLAHLRKFERRR
ncbi:MAG: alpha/beta hydrolase [Chloroflexi bacterium]|nr:alpha/beta hydrolase [Chloroflexota bacterium]